MDHNTYTFQSQYQQDDALENENYYSIINEDGSLEYEDEDAVLISLVRDYPFLYNKELTDFKDNIKKQNAWAEIATILNMTAEECQSRWTRLRERYTREKKQREAENTTGSGAIKRKPFEFFENMQFLERFIKRRRTITNMKTFQASPVGKYSSLQKNFGSHIGQQISSAKMATIKQFPDTESCSTQNIRNFNTSNEKENNKNNTNVNANTDLLSTYTEDLSKDSKSSIHSSDISETNSVSELNTSATVQKRDLLSKRKVKGKQPDVLHNAICKVTSLLENKYSTSSQSTLQSTSQSTLKPEVEEDVALCQLILSSLINMSPNKKTDKKKDLLHIIYNI